MNEIANLELPPAAADRVAARAFEADGLLVLQLEGTAETPDGDGLSSFLKRAHALARRMRTRLVVVDLQRLKFMTSACFKGFVSWISAVQDLQGERYRIRFRINPSIRWQSGSVRTLVSFAVDTVSMEQGAAR